MPPRKNKKIIDDNTVNAVNTFVEKAVAKQEENSSEDEIEVYVEKKQRPRPTISQPLSSAERVEAGTASGEQPPLSGTASSKVRATKKPAREKTIDDFQLLYKSQKEELDLLRSIHIKSLREPVNICNVPTIQSAREPLSNSLNDVDTRRQMLKLRFD